jgi:hypothetical protein
MRALIRALVTALALLLGGAASAGDDPLAEATALNKQVEALYQQGPYSEAEPLCKRVLVWETALGPDHPDVAERHCQLNCPSKTSPTPDARSRGGDGILPLAGRFCSEDPERRARDEMALKVEGVVNGGMHAEKTLGGAS